MSIWSNNNLIERQEELVRRSEEIKIAAIARASVIRKLRMQNNEDGEREERKKEREERSQEKEEEEHEVCGPRHREKEGEEREEEVKGSQRCEAISSSKVCCKKCKGREEEGEKREEEKIADGSDGRDSDQEVEAGYEGRRSSFNGLAVGDYRILFQSPGDCGRLCCNFTLRDVFERAERRHNCWQRRRRSRPQRSRRQDETIFERDEKEPEDYEAARATGGVEITSQKD